MNQINHNFSRKYIILLYHTPFWIWTLALLTGTSLPGSAINLPDFQFMDKLMHLTAYTGVGFFLRRSGPYFNSEKWINSPGFMTLVWGTVIGLLDELHQIFVPGRFAEFADFGADFIGVILGILFYLLVVKWIPQLK